MIQSHLAEITYLPLLRSESWTTSGCRAGGLAFVTAENEEQMLLWPLSVKKLTVWPSSLLRPNCAASLSLVRSHSWTTSGRRAGGLAFVTAENEEHLLLCPLSNESFRAGGLHRCAVRHVETTKPMRCFSANNKRRCFISASSLRQAVCLSAVSSR